MASALCSKKPPLIDKVSLCATLFIPAWGKEALSDQSAPGHGLGYYGQGTQGLEAKDLEYTWVAPCPQPHNGPWDLEYRRLR